MGKREINSNWMPNVGSYMFVQTAMLFCVHALKYKMPTWVIWFPTWVYGIMLVIALVIFVVMMVTLAVIDR